MLRRKFRSRAFFLVLCAISVPASSAGADDVKAGVEWLHSFEYERALAAFEGAERADPLDAMAYWGQAMCYQQFLWGNENVEQARRILARARANGAVARATPQARAWLATLDALFGDGDRPSRLAAFAAAMGKLATGYPDDPDVASLRGLALMATRGRGLAGAGGSAHTDHANPQLIGSAEQEQAAAIFGRVLDTHPRHPGALHYLIHAWDDPVNAHKALDAARVYPSVAPESSHARHMPAHVFVQLGMWPEAIASDGAAAAAAEAKVTRDGLPVTAQDFHPLSWLVYEYLQAGRTDDARRALEPLRRAAQATQDPRLLSLLATLRTRVAVESGAWSDLTGPSFVNYEELFGVAYGAAHRGDTSLAERGRIRLSDMAKLPRYAERRPLLEIMALQVGAVLRARSGDMDGALALLADATAAERELPPSIGPPPLIKPAQEQYAELLLQAGRPPEAAAQFEGALRRARNRRAAVIGLERARAATVETRGTSQMVAGVASGVMILLILVIAWRRRLLRAKRSGLSRAKSKGLKSA